MIKLDTSTFDEYTKSVDQDTVLIVDFWASWCGPCKVMEPVLEGIESDGLAVVAKVNADDEQELLKRFDVLSLPTFLKFKDGELVGRVVGAKPRQALLDALGIGIAAGD